MTALIFTDNIRRAVYACLVCGEYRVWGFLGEPDPAHLLCGHCHRHTLHEFIKITIGWVGRPCPLAQR